MISGYYTYMISSGGFRAARLPRQVTRGVHTVRLRVEKNPVTPPNCRTLVWSVVLTIGRLCPIVPQDNIRSGKQLTRILDQVVATANFSTFPTQSTTLLNHN